MKWNFVALIASLAVIGLFYLAGAPDGGSQHFNLAWVSAFGIEFWQGTPYPRHLPALWDGFGGVDFFFYAPLPFWITELMRAVCFGCGDDRVLALGGGVLLILSGWAFYIAVRRLVAPGPAAIGAILYMIMPYHLLADWFHRQALGEFAAYIAAPLVMVGLHSIIRGHGGLMFALGWAIMLLCHLPTALLTAHILVVVALVWIILQLLSRAARTIPVTAGRAILYGFLGTALAAIYWVPAIALIQDVSPEMLYTPYLQAQNWLYFDGRDAPNQDFQQIATLLLIPGVLITLIPWVIGGWGRVHILLALVPAVLIAVAMSALAAPMWEHWVINKAQFPWRFLLLLDFAAALSISLALATKPWAHWPQLTRLALMALMLVGTGLILPDGVRAILRSPASLAEEFKRYGANEYVPPDLIEEVLERGLVYDRTTEKLIMDVVLDARSRPDMNTGEMTYRKFTIAAPDGLDRALIPMPYWKHWKPTEAGITIEPDPDTGMTRITAPAGENPVTVVLPWHWSEWVGLGMSALAALILLALVFVSRTPLARPAEPRI